MSMTIEHNNLIPTLMHRFLRATATAASILLIWFMATIIITLLPGAAPAAAIVFPTERLMNTLPKDVYVLDWSGITAKTTSAAPLYVRDLYKAGAFLVLPSRKSGCLTLRTQK